MKNLKNYIFTQVAQHNLPEDQAKQMLLELKEIDTIDKNEDIAVIGMAGKFSNSDNLDEYWKNMEQGTFSIRKLPLQRRNDVEVYERRFDYDELLEKGFVKPDGSLDLEYEKVGYLNEIDKFDYNFFKIPPREARAMGCEQRLFLETAYEALEDAGYGGNSLAGSNTAVFVGMDHSGGLVYKKIAQADAMAPTGSWPGILASRISYIFNFKGPALVIDTACSSGLVCVHEAVKSINNGESDIAVAGGISAILYNPITSTGDKDLESIESKRGIVSTFDNSVDGTVWGEGVGAVVLKKLSKAIADGDPIHAVIKGSAINNDGASNGITAPDAAMQEKLLLSAWDAAKVSPETIQYIEAHGTGTVLGDSIEVKAISEAFSKKTVKKQFCAVGSQKSSMGHLVAASGMGGLIKIILMLKNKKLPPSLNFARPNEYIDFINSPVFVNDELREWKEMEGTPRRAGVSSFGFSGTNCHVIVEEYVNQKSNEAKNPYEIFTVSAKNEKSLMEYLKKYVEYLEKADVNLSDLCYTANTGRGHYEYRVGMLVKSIEDAKAKLKTLINHGLEAKVEDCYYNYFKMSYKHKGETSIHELTEDNRKILNEESSKAIEILRNKFDITTAKDFILNYTKGADVEWSSMYNSAEHMKLHVPTYPLERIRCWYEEDKETIEARSKKVTKVQNTMGHPLVHQKLVTSLYQDIYSTLFNPNELWILKEHVIFDVPVLPGTSYVEMTVETCKDYFNEGMEIKNLTFYTPLMLKDYKNREFHTIINKSDDRFETVFISKEEDDTSGETWVRHGDCAVLPLEDNTLKHIDRNALKERLDKEAQKGDSVIKKHKDPNEGEKREIVQGPHWHGYEVISTGHHERLAHFQLEDSLMEDFDLFNLQVALLDDGINLSINDVYEGFYLPYYYGTIKYYKRMPRHFYSHMELKLEDNKDHQTFTMNVSLFDENGEVFLEARDYSVKLVTKTANEFRQEEVEENKYYHTAWVKEEDNREISELSGTTLFLQGDSEIGKQLDETLRKEGKVITVKLGSSFQKIGEDNYTVSNTLEGYQALFEELRNASVTRIIHSYMLEESITFDAETVEEIKNKKSKGLDSLFFITKALIQNKYKDNLDIILLSDYANKVKEEQSIIKPSNHSFQTMGKVITMENNNFICRAIDIDSLTTPNTIIEEIKRKKTVYNTAIRSNERYVEQFEELEFEAKEEEFKTVKNGVYVITGGMGGLGLAVAKHIASKNKAKLILIGRSKLPSKSNWFNILSSDNEKQKRAIQQILEMEDLGCQVTTISADISNYEEMKEVWNDIIEEFGKVNGVVHCAGNAGNGFIFTKEKAVFDSVVNPKMLGTWNIRKLLQGQNVDFCIFYSSMLSLFDEMGQSDYSAANSYMDAFATLLRSEGVPALSVNWPAWKEIGMAIDFGVDERNNFIEPIGVEDAFNCLDTLINNDVTQALPGSLNYGFFKENGERLGFRISEKIQAKVLNAVVKKTKKIVTKKVANKEQNFTINQDDSIENILMNAWCKVLGLDKIDLYDRFSNLGGDSLMAMQLLKVIDRAFPDMVSVSDIFTYPSVAEMTEYISEKLESKKEKKEDRKEDKKEDKDDKTTATKSDEDLISMLDSLEAGDASIESVMAAFQNK